MYLIAGIDPGKTCGLACIDLNGKLVFKAHRTFGGTDWLINTISAVGTPVVIAGDKPNPSEVVRKVNTAFNSKLFRPERELRITEKRTAAKNLGIKNPHERDAYMAAVSAYNSYANKFKQAEHIAKSKDYKNVEQLKAKVISKYSISEALGNKRANRK